MTREQLSDTGDDGHDCVAVCELCGDLDHRYNVAAVTDCDCCGTNVCEEHSAPLGILMLCLRCRNSMIGTVDPFLECPAFEGDAMLRGLSCEDVEVV